MKEDGDAFIVFRSSQPMGNDAKNSNSEWSSLLGSDQCKSPDLCVLRRAAKGSEVCSFTLATWWLMTKSIRRLIVVVGLLIVGLPVGATTEAGAMSQTIRAGSYLAPPISRAYRAYQRTPPVLRRTTGFTMSTRYNRLSSERYRPSYSGGYRSTYGRPRIYAPPARYVAPTYVIRRR